MFYRTEKDGGGWGRDGCQRIKGMPGPAMDTLGDGTRLLDRLPDAWRFAWTAASLSAQSRAARAELDGLGFRLVGYLCLPGSFLIAGEQAVFDPACAQRRSIGAHA
jgi:hypothetical protein